MGAKVRPSARLAPAPARGSVRCPGLAAARNALTRAVMPRAGQNGGFCPRNSTVFRLG